MSSLISTSLCRAGRLTLQVSGKRIQWNRFMHHNKSFGAIGTPSLLQTSENVFNKTPNLKKLHTNGDQEMAEFLREEITNEQKSAKAHGGNLSGFTLQSSDSCNLTFTKKGEETVNVKFSVNDSVDEEAAADYGEQEQDLAPALKSRPPFVVEISKDGKNFLCIHCAFPAVMDDMEAGGQSKEYEDAIEIVEVSFRNESSASEDGDYILPGHVMDANLYDMLLNMLEERGVDGHFVEGLVEFSTAYEHKMYVSFLDKLQKFALSD